MVLATTERKEAGLGWGDLRSSGPLVAKGDSPRYGGGAAEVFKDFENCLVLARARAPDPGTVILG
jgi:hypothetical protein